VKLLYAHMGLAAGGAALLESIRPCQPRPFSDAAAQLRIPLRIPSTSAEPGAAEAIAIYSDCLRRWHILERFPRPDWSIVDLWVARRLLAQFMPAARVEAILRLASPHFPRRHGDPEDYLRRTVARAALPPPARTVCHSHTRASTPPAAAMACSNSTGGR
jgi:hypothetical protein